MTQQEELDLKSLALALFVEREVDRKRFLDLTDELRTAREARDIVDGWFRQTQDKLESERRVYEGDREGFNRTLLELDCQIVVLEDLASKRLAEIVLLKAPLEDVSNATLDLVGGVLDKERRKQPMGTNQFGDPAFCLSCGAEKGRLGYFCGPCFDADTNTELFTELFDAWHSGDRDFPRKRKSAR